MSSSPTNKLKEKKQSSKQPISSFLFGCCDDNNVQRFNGQIQTNAIISDKNTTSPKLFMNYHNNKLKTKLSKKQLSPSPKNIYREKEGLKHTNNKFRKQIKSLELNQQQTEDAQSPTRCGKKQINKNNKIFVLSKKNGEITPRNKVTNNNQLQNNSILHAYTNISNTKVSKVALSPSQKDNRKTQNQSSVRPNEAFFPISFNNNQIKKTSPYNPELNFTFSNNHNNFLQSFSPPARIEKKELQIPEQLCSNIKDLIQKSPLDRKLNHNLTKSPREKVSSPMLKDENKSPKNLKGCIESGCEIKRKAEDQKAAVRDISEQNHLTMASDDGDSKVTQINANQTEKQSIQQNPKLLYDVKEQQNVKQSVISQNNDQKKNPQPYFAKNNNIFANILNPEYDSRINVSYGTSYNPSLIFQSYKPTSHRYLLGNLSSATVNSIMEPIRESQIKQKVQQSVVMLDVFNTPQYQKQLQ